MDKVLNCPKVSIIVPVYNGADYLGRAIDSALAQSYKNIEVIVVNDGSSDGGKTANIAKSYGNRIKYYEKENGGVSSALNYGINVMTGDYFSWLSHDDEYREDKIEKQLLELQRQNNPRTLALCDTEFIDENSNVIDKRWVTPDTGVYDSEQALIFMIRKSFSGISLLIPKTAFAECGEFDTALRFTQDADMWRRIFLHGYALAVDKHVYARSRLHGKQQTNMHRERFKEENERTIPGFCDELCGKEMYKAVQTLLITLNKNAILDAADHVEKKLQEKGQLSFRTSMEAKVARFYGYVRPYIRKTYYKIKFGVDSKESRG